MVSVGSMTANLAVYVLQLLARDGWGRSALRRIRESARRPVGAGGSGLALQTVVARERCMARATPSCGPRIPLHRDRRGVAAALAPAIAWLLDTESDRVAVGSRRRPRCWCCWRPNRGLLQGHGRFGDLSVVLAGAGVRRWCPAVDGAGDRRRGRGGMWSRGGRDRRDGRRRRDWSSGVWVSEDRRCGVGVVSVLAASQVQLAMIALSSVDLLIAASCFREADAGIYAAGAVATKVAFWLPQAIGRRAVPADGESGALGASGALRVGRARRYRRRSW